MTLPTVSLPHIVRQPTRAAGAKPPLLVLLHGLGSNEADLMGLADHIDPRFLVVSVRAPQVLGPYGFAWYSIAGAIGRLRHDEEEAEAGRLAAERAVQEIVAAYDADPTRVYLMGFSQGAVMSLGVALIRPDLIAGAVIMSGALLPSFATRIGPDDLLRKLSILVVHGRWDEVLPIDNAREIRDFLAARTDNLAYHEYAMGHEVSLESIERISEWLTERLDVK